MAQAVGGGLTAETLCHVHLRDAGLKSEPGSILGGS